MRIALGAIPYPASLDDAVRQVKLLLNEASAQGAAIVAFPEASIPGYRGLGRDPGIVDQSALDLAWRDVARAAADAEITVILGTERHVGGSKRLTALVIGPDGTQLGFQDKIQLDPSEDDIYIPGTERQVFTVDGLCFGIAICHEGWRYPETVRWAAQRGAQILFHLHFSEDDASLLDLKDYADPRNTFHEKAALCRAAENTIFYAGVNYATPKSNVASAVIPPDGSLINWHPRKTPGVLTADIDLSQATALLAQRCRAPYSTGH